MTTRFFWVSDFIRFQVRGFLLVPALGRGQDDRQGARVLLYAGRPRRKRLSAHLWLGLQNRSGYYDDLQSGSRGHRISRRRFYEVSRLPQVCHSESDAPSLRCAPGITRAEMQFFYAEQEQRLECLNHETVRFADVPWPWLARRLPVVLLLLVIILKSSIGPDLSRIWYNDYV